MTVDVLGSGAVAMDLVLQCEDLPREDGFAFVHGERWLPGGSCSNVLVALTCLGVGCGIVAKVGDDTYGNATRADLDASGVSTAHLLTKIGGTSLHTFVAVARNGSRSILAGLGDSFLSLAEAEVDRAMVEGIKVFYTDMFTGKPALKLARLCRDAAIPVVFNLETSPTFMKLCNVPTAEIEEMLSLCHFFCVSREGLKGLTTIADEKDAAVAIYEKYRPVKGVVATLGEKGTFWVGREGTVSVPAFDIEAVDTTGAGDAFAGGLIFGRLLKQWDIKTSLRFANACGAIKCTQPGPRIKATEQDVWALVGVETPTQRPTEVLPFSGTTAPLGGAPRSRVRKGKGAK